MQQSWLIVLLCWVCLLAISESKFLTNQGQTIKSASEVQHPPALETIKSLHHTLTKKHTSTDFMTNVQQLINRVLSRAGVNFAFTPVMELIPYEEVDGQLMDVFEIDAKDNSIIFRGSSGIALSTAFGHYLRYYTNSDFHWEKGGSYSFEAFPKSSDGLPIPASKERVVFLSKWRYYQNTCTASYSFAWRTWQSWEMEIDWMAMNGFNLPLAFTGQEIVWQKLWRFYGVSDQGLQAYFSGKFSLFVSLILLIFKFF